MIPINQQQRDMLERMIDDHGLSALLQTIAMVCSEKHEHICGTIGPGPTAKGWLDAAKALNHRALIERARTS